MSHASIALLTLALAGAASLLSGCGLRCGHGTIEKNGECIVDDGSGGDTTAPAAGTCADACGKQLDTCHLFAETKRADCVSFCEGLSASDQNLSCFAGASCNEIARGQCSIAHPPPTVRYSSFQDAGGPFCGRDSDASRTECLAGDTCASLATHTCDPSSGDAYASYEKANGPFCGRDADASRTECRPFDLCVANGRCEPATDSSYQAFENAGGTFCGRDADASRTECVAGDTCQSETTHVCTRAG
jgi:hypothetical protein